MNPVATTSLASTLGAALGLYLESKGIIGATPVVTALLAAGTGVLTGLAHYVHRKFFPISATPPGAVAAVETAAVQSIADAVTPPTASVVKAVLPLLLMLTLAAVASGGLVACAVFQTAPTSPEIQKVTAVTNLATIGAITGTSKDATVWKDRAVKFKAVALKIQADNADATATLASLNADLQPELAKLPPLDAAAANFLIVSLEPYLQPATNDTVVLNTQARVAVILSAVIAICGNYGA